MVIHDYYDEATETLYIADVTDSGNPNPEGLPVVDEGPYGGDIFHGYMTSHMPRNELHEILGRGEDPVEYAFETVPAPGTCARDRMGWIPWPAALEINASSFTILH